MILVGYDKVKFGTFKAYVSRVVINGKVHHLRRGFKRAEEAYNYAKRFKEKADAKKS